MQQDLYEELKQTLRQDERLVIDGQLNKNKIVELGLRLDRELLSLLAVNKALREHFFSKVGDTLVFDKIEFQRFVSNKQFLPDSYTSYKNKIGLAVDREYLTESKEVELVWPYKDCVLEGGQTKEDEKRNEIFWNKTLAPDQIDRLLDPKVFTNWKQYDEDGEHEVDEVSSDANMLIKGNNLLTLHSLRRTYEGQVKLIYIDPPYNTGNDDFGYNDRFNHSSWLTFMRNRLEVARDLLSDDGSLWMNIDDDEGHYLKVLADEVFGRDNFVSNVVWQKKFSPQNDARWFSDSHDHILVYALNKEVWRPNLLPRTEEMNSRYNNPDDDPRGPWTSGDLSVKTYTDSNDYSIKTPSGRVVNPPKGYCWRVSQEKLDELISDNRIWFGEDGSNVPRIKRFLSEVKSGVTPQTIWLHDEVGNNQDSKREVNELLDTETFSTPKPERLIKQIIHLGSDENDLILDFFAGSGTAGAVAHKMNRQYIICEQMEYVESITKTRLQKVIEGEQGGISEEVEWQGGGSFIYAELHQSNAAYIQAIEEAESSEELSDIWERMKEEAFLSYRIKPKDIDKSKEEFEKLSLDQQKQLLIDLLDKNQLYVNYSEIEDERYGITDDDKRLNHQFYSQ